MTMTMLERVTAVERSVQTQIFRMLKDTFLKCKTMIHTHIK